MSARTVTGYCRARVMTATALSALLAAPVFADVTVNQKTTGKGPIGAAASGDSVQYLKGSKMRIDQTRGDDETSMIIDADAQRMISLNHKKKEAEIYDTTKMAADMQKIQSSDIKANVTPTSQTRQIAGQTCTVHNIEIEIPMTMGNNSMSMMMAGPACLVKNAPGAKDYETFYKTAIEKGLFFSDPRQAKAQPGQAKGMARLYQEMASRGLPYAQEFTMKFQGNDMMAGMMNKMGGATMSTEVTSVTTGPIADSLFEIPAGYKQKQQK
jgi:Domain of unknown function (DUF4412)